MGLGEAGLFNMHLPMRLVQMPGDAGHFLHCDGWWHGSRWYCLGIKEY